MLQSGGILYKLVDINEDLTYNVIANLNPFRYRGYYFDVETGLYYLNSRYYDAELGRFINADDISILNQLQEEFNGLNLYAYCLNNPVNDIDTNGTWSWKSFWKGVGKVVLGIVTVAVVTAAVAVTAGAVALMAGASIGVGLTVVGAATVGGMVAGGFSILGQGISNGFDNINLVDVAIDTFFGSGYGAVTGGIGAGASVGTKVLGSLGKVALSGITSAMHSVNHGESFSETMKGVGEAMFWSGIFQTVALGFSLKGPTKNNYSSYSLKNIVKNIFNGINSSSLASTGFFRGLAGIYNTITGKYN